MLDFDGRFGTAGGLVLGVSAQLLLVPVYPGRFSAAPHWQLDIRHLVSPSLVQ
jgi:hypothetical protein